MITDEQIKQLAVSCGFKLTNETGDDLKPYVYEFARELIALAQQVKPLEFVKTGDYDNSTPPVEHYSATTEFGIIELIVDGDVAVPLISTYDFMRDVVGYDLAGFFKRNSKSLRDEIDTVLKALLAPETN